MRDYHRPVRFGGNEFDEAIGGLDPAESSQIAHESARSLLARARKSHDDELVARLVTYTDQHGLAELADLWSASPAASLPGMLWRLYLTRAFISKNPVEVSLLFATGQEILATVDPVIAGVETPVGPDEVLFTADEVLRGAFTGDFAIALDRSAAFCRVTAAGCTARADDIEEIDHEGAHRMTRRALRLSTMADELSTGARLWRAHSLD